MKANADDDFTGHFKAEGATIIKLPSTGDRKNKKECVATNITNVRNLLERMLFEVSYVQIQTLSVELCLFGQNKLSNFRNPQYMRN